MNYQHPPTYIQGHQYPCKQPNGAPVYYYQPQPPPSQAHPVVVIPQQEVQYQQYQSFDGVNETRYSQQPTQYQGNYLQQQPSISRQPAQHLDQYRLQQQTTYQQNQNREQHRSYQAQSIAQPERRQLAQQIHQKPPKHQYQYQPYPVKPNRSPSVLQEEGKSPPRRQEKQKVPVPDPKSATTEAPREHHETPFDYQLLLLSMADDYINNARNMASAVAHAQSRQHSEEYYQLMAIGLGCMDSVLKNFKLHPRTEAKLRLRYATLLHEETENPEEAEKVLSKGIQLTEKHKLLDLKYSMQHLLARTLFETRQKAALKFLDKIIPDAEAYDHRAWVYAFRFLRVTLSLQTFSHSEALASLQHLQTICDLSRGHDRAIFVTSATMQAMVHLKISGPESIEQAQQAIAVARSEQLDPSLQQLPQITAFLSFMDLVSVLQLHNEPDQVSAKMSAMNNIMDGSRPDFKWTSNGSFRVPLGQGSENQTTQDTGGIFQKLPDGEDALVFCALPRDELYSVAFLLSSLASFHRNAGDGKTEKFALEGLKGLKGDVF